MTQNEELNYLYNNIVFSIFSSCKKNNFSKNSNKLALFLSHPSAIYFYKNIINFIPANNLDIFILSKCDVNISLSNRIINYSDEYICQDYSLILCERNILQKIYKRNNTQRFCIISHSIDECYKIEDLKIAHLAILISLKQNNNDDLFRTKNLNDYNLKLLSHIENKCEIVATGPFHLDGVHEFKKPKTELLNDLGAILNINIPTDKPIICILEDEFSQIGSLITGMNKLSSFCTVIFKPWYSLSSPLLKRLKRNIIIYNKKDFAPNLLKQCSDFIFAGYQSGTFISSIAAGLNVLGFYTRYTTQHCGVIKIPRHFKKSIPFILDPTDARHKEIILHKFYSDNKLFDILDHDSILNAILGTEYLDWYHKVLPSLQKEAFDDYIVKGSAKKTAEYIMRFARDGTLGKDCSAIYLKK